MPMTVHGSVKAPPKKNPGRRRRSRKLWGGGFARRADWRKHKKTRSYKRHVKAMAAVNPNRKRRRKMAKKLYGAAAKAHARRMARMGRKTRRRRRRRNPSHRVRRRRARRAAPMRRRRKRRSRVSVTVNPPRRRRRRRRSRRRSRVRVMVNPPRRRRRKRRSRRRNPSPYRRRRRRSRRRYGGRRRRNPRPSTQRSMLRARRAIRNRYKTALGKATMRRYRMRSNPGAVLDAVKAAVPVALSLYAARFASSWLAPRIPGLDRLPMQAQGPVMAGAVALLAHFGTKKIGFLQRHRGAIMLGVGLNAIDSLLSAFAPASVRGMFGLSEYVRIDGTGGMGDYFEINGGQPIDDEMALSEYISVGELEEELGDVQEELGVEEELGATALDRAYLGGMPSSALMKPIPREAMLAPIPHRSFTKEIPRANTHFDNPRALYTGIFDGGF